MADVDGAGWMESGTLRAVADGTHDNRVCPGLRDLDGAAQQPAVLVAALKIVHLAGSPGPNPVLKTCCVLCLRRARETFNGGDAAEVKAEGGRPLFEPLFELRSPDGNSHTRARGIDAAVFQSRWMRLSPFMSVGLARWRSERMVGEMSRRLPPGRRV